MKDDEELSLYTDRGIYTAEEAARIREAALELQPSIESRMAPFDNEWTDWYPPTRLAPATVPEGWTDYPGGDIHLSTLHYERGSPGRRYDERRRG